MKASDLEREQVLDYFAAQMADDPMVHVEEVAVVRSGSILHDIWDVHCRDSRWWAIGNCSTTTPRRTSRAAMSR